MSVLISNQDLAKKVAGALLDIKAVGFSLDQPVTFKSGIISPVYVDNRTFPAHTTEWKVVIGGFSQLISSQHLEFDFIAGIETAGIPHSAALGFSLDKPSVFVRKKAKDHGTKKMVEGGDVKEKKVLLIEDLVTTGGSSLAGVESLRQAGAVVTDCLVIVSYGFEESVEAFAQAGVNLHSLTDFPTILSEAIKRNLLTEEQKTSIESWLEDPFGWANKR
ncbi:MAG: orotate phosphoribosyltransferase [Patescibacteria group bacterium]